MEYVEENVGPDDFSDIDIAKRISAFLYARRYDDTVPFEDYQHYGIVGYLEAKKKFDPKRGVSFKTFAIYRIKGSILNGISKYSEKLDFSFYRSRRSKNSFSLLKKLDNKVIEENNFEKFSSCVVEFTLESLLDDVFDGLLVEDEQVSVFESRSANKLLGAIQELLDNERDVILYHYFYDFSFKAIAEYMALSKGRISQIHKNAMKKLLDQLSEAGTFSSYL